MVVKRAHRSFRCIGTSAGATSAHETSANQQDGDDKHCKSQYPGHYFASRRTTGSAAGAGNSTVSAKRLRSGIATTASSAKMLAPIGSVPHITPCHAGGGCTPT